MEINMRQPVIFAGLTIGSLLVLGGVLDDGVDPGDIRSLGALLTIWMLIWLFSARSQQRDQTIFELGRQIGDDEGFQRGRRAQPTVVRFNGRTEQDQLPV